MMSLYFSFFLFQHYDGGVVLTPELRGLKKIGVARSCPYPCAEQGSEFKRSRDQYPDILM